MTENSNGGSLTDHIINLTGQVSSMSAKLDSYLGKHEDLKTEIGSVRTDLKSEIGDVRNDVAAVKAEVRDMKQKTALTKARLGVIATIVTGVWSAIAVFAIPAVKKILGL